MSKRTKPQTQSGNRPPIEGEGNRTADAEYRAGAERFVKSGKVEEKAREARRALDSDEAEELEEAEKEGRAHAAEEDPQVVLDRREKGVVPDED